MYVSNAENVEKNGFWGKLSIVLVQKTHFEIHARWVLSYTLRASLRENDIRSSIRSLGIRTAAEVGATSNLTMLQKKRRLTEERSDV